MERITRKIFDYIYEMKRTLTNQRLAKDLRKEVDIGATGTQKYRIKKGPNKGKTI